MRLAHTAREPYADAHRSRAERRAGGAHGGRHARPGSAPRAPTPEATGPQRERRGDALPAREATRRSAIDLKFGSPMVGRLLRDAAADSPRVMADK
jgi:hypothetical protein